MYEMEKEQKPSELSEEDEAVLDALIRRLEGDDIYVSPHLAVECLKSLRPQQKQKLSEDEQDKRITELKTFLARCNGFNRSNREKAFKMIDSLRTKPHWKPSEEQLEAARYVSQFDYGGHRAVLVSLYEQLKKLCTTE